MTGYWLDAKGHGRSGIRRRLHNVPITFLLLLCSSIRVVRYLELFEDGLCHGLDPDVSFVSCWHDLLSWEDETVAS